MRWWPWRRRDRSVGIVDAEAALRESREQRAETAHALAGDEQVAQRLRRLRDTNHFGSAIQHALRGNGGDARDSG